MNIQAEYQSGFGRHDRFMRIALYFGLFFKKRPSLAGGNPIDRLLYSLYNSASDCRLIAFINKAQHFADLIQAARPMIYHILYLH